VTNIVFDGFQRVDLS